MSTCHKKQRLQADLAVLRFLMDFRVASRLHFSPTEIHQIWTRLFINANFVCLRDHESSGILARVWTQ
jgi:hypothetical protein